MNNPDHDSKKDRAVTAPQPLSRRLLRLFGLGLLPILTVLFFAALSAFSLFEIRTRRGAGPRFKAPEEISAEALARYEKESRELGKLRKARRAGITAESLFAEFRKPAKDRALPEERHLLADFQALLERDPEASVQVFLTAIGFLRDLPQPEKSGERERELIESLLLQAALSSEGKIGLSGSQKEQCIALLERAVEKGSRAGSALLFVLQREAGPGDLCRLEEIAAKSLDPQVKSGIERLIEGLKEREIARGD